MSRKYYKKYFFPTENNFYGYKKNWKTQNHFGDIPKKYLELLKQKWSKPSVLSNEVLQNISLDKFNYSEKIDGIHTYLLIFNKKIYNVTNIKDNYQIDSTNFREMNFSGDCILETEYYQNIYYIFDVYYLNGENYSQKFLHDRLNSINKYIDELGPSFKIKKFYPITGLNELLEYIKKDKSPEGNDIDGIVLQRIDKPFFQEGFEPNCYKFKPSHLNTIDFLLKFNKKENIYDLYLIETYEKNFRNIFKKLPKEKNMYRIYDINNPINIRSRYFYKNEKLLIYFDSPFYPNLGALKLTENWNKNNYSQNRINQIDDLIHKMKSNPKDYHNKIVELSLTDDKKWVPLRLRQDKTLPNTYRVGQSNVSVIFDPIKLLENIYFQKHLTMNEKDLDIIHKINQTFRKYIIEKYVRKFRPNASIIDLCGGRGADEFNLYSNGVSNFFVIDNDTTALKRYFDRTFLINNKKYEPLTTNYYHKSNWLNVNFLKHKLDKNYDSIKKDLNSRYEFYKGKVNIVLMNYAIHYLCDDIEKIKSLGEFVSSVLFRNGIFIITYFDGDEIMKAVENNVAKIGPFNIEIIKQDKEVTIAKMPLPSIKEGSDIYAEEPLVKKDTIKILEENLSKLDEFYIYNETKRYIDDIQGFKEFIDYYKLIKVGIYRLKN